LKKPFLIKNRAIFLSLLERYCWGNNTEQNGLISSESPQYLIKRKTNSSIHCHSLSQRCALPQVGHSVQAWLPLQTTAKAQLRRLTSDATATTASSIVQVHAHTRFGRI
jgi:hypothetical protein